MKTSTNPRQQRERTRARLVEAALRVFAAQGYDHATVEEIALAAGYSKGAYYFHFDSKEGIFLELLSDWIEEQTRRLHPFESEPSLLTMMVTLDSLLRYDDREAHWRLLLPEFWAQSHRIEKARRTLRKAYERWLELLAKAFEKAEKNGLLALRVKPEVAASLILAAHDGLIVRSRLSDGGDKELKLPQMLGALITIIASLSEPAASPIIAPVRKRIARGKR